MIARSLVLGFLLLAVGSSLGRAAPADTAADQITLRDGSVVKGLVTSVDERSARLG